MRAQRRSTLCACGGDVYVRALGGADLDPVWRCDNCGAESSRKSVRRRSNRERAVDAFRAIRAEWAPVDAALDALVAAGQAGGGGLLVHASVFNFHLNTLLDTATPTSHAVRYHTAQARADLDRARAYVAERSGAGVQA